MISVNSLLHFSHKRIQPILLYLTGHSMFASISFYLIGLNRSKERIHAILAVVLIGKCKCPVRTAISMDSIARGRCLRILPVYPQPDSQEYYCAMVLRKALECLTISFRVVGHSRSNHIDISLNPNMINNNYFKIN